MRYRFLGRTGTKVSEICFGTQTFGWGADEGAAHAMADHFVEAGGNFFDTSDKYNDGESERILGTWLRTQRRDDVVIASKTYFDLGDGPNEMGATRKRIMRQIDRTLERLGTDHLDLYQVHSATHESGVLDDRRLLAEMSELKREGVRFGFSTSGPDQASVIARALDATVDGVRLFDAVQATWNLLEPSADAALAEAHAAGLGVIVKEAVANGRLTDRNDDGDFADRHRVLAGEAERLGTTIDALALRAALERPWADVVLSGAATVAQLEANAAALAVAWDDAAAERLATLAEDPAAYWRRRSALAWT
ncbi:MAG: aldo/keto reductase [Trueperaceae bacterium]